MDRVTLRQKKTVRAILRRAPPRLCVDLPGLAVLRKRICESTGQNDGLTLNGCRERPRYDGVRVGALDVPEPHLVRQVFLRDPKVLTPLFYVSKPIGRSIRINQR